MWAYEYEAGKFIAGEILGDTLYMYAPTGRGEKWVMNSEGIVLEYSSEPFHKSDEIIAGINAHYGTSFYQEDDIDKDFTIGETMPNWNAYEKIEIVAKLYLLPLENGYVGAAVVGNSISYYGNQDSDVNIYNSEGILQERTVPSPLIEDITQIFAILLQIELTSWKILERSGNIENLSEYVIIDE